MAEQRISPLGAGVICLIIVTLALILLPMTSRHHGHGSRTHCAANLHGLYQSMYTYANSNHGKFPMAGKTELDAHAIGFRDKRVKDEPTELNNNITASLWIMVRDGSSQAKQFVCPSSGDDYDALQYADKEPIDIQDAYDFAQPSNLSYSMLNIHGTIQGRQWGSSVRAERVIMADNNNAQNDNPQQLHTTTKHSAAKRLTPELLSLNENSQNHSDGEGQHMLFGDGHAEFTTDPFQGQSGDNIMASDVQKEVNQHEMAAMPFLRNDQGSIPNFRRDSMLLPITGARGGLTTLDPSD